jgi:hypothetical protein
MTRKTFLTIASTIPILLGTFVVLAPGALLAQVKGAVPSEAAEVMARTVGVLLLAFGALNFLVRGHDDSPTLRCVLVADLLLQLALLPIDPIAYAGGVFHGLGSFVPNTILHLLLAWGFAHHLLRMRAESQRQTRKERSGSSAHRASIPQSSSS